MLQTPSSCRSLLATSVLLLFAVVTTTPFAPAQGKGPIGSGGLSGMPHPLPGLPITPPPVDHPGLVAQPLLGDTATRRPGGGAAGGGGRPAGPGAMAKPPMPPETTGPLRAGKDLKAAVGKVKALRWYESLTEAKSRSAATSKPILWVQALGDIDGFA